MDHDTWQLAAIFLSTFITAANFVVMLQIKLEVSRMENKLKDWAHSQFEPKKNRPLRAAGE